jgi:hypothetical protein
LDEKQEFLQLLRDMWDRGDSSLRNIYPSWEDLESNLQIRVEKHHSEYSTVKKPCPYCGAIIEIKTPTEDLFPYDECKSCKNTFHVSDNLAVRKLTDEENENMPAEWVRVLHALDRKKLAIVFKLE